MTKAQALQEQLASEASLTPVWERNSSIISKVTGQDGVSAIIDNLNLVLVQVEHVLDFDVATEAHNDTTSITLEACAPQVLLADSEPVNLINMILPSHSSAAPSNE